MSIDLNEQLRQMALSQAMGNASTSEQPMGRTVGGQAAQPLCHKPMNPVCDAAEMGDLARLTALVATGCDVNVTGENGNSALAFACANGHADCAHMLITKGARVHQCSNVGSSPLHAACWADSARCARILIDANADINLCSPNLATPLHVAVQANRDEVLSLLIARGADRNASVLMKSFSLTTKRTPLQLGARAPPNRTQGREAACFAAPRGHHAQHRG